MLTKNVLVVSRYWHWYSRTLMERLQLSGPDSMVLTFLESHELISQDFLCTFLMLDKATMAKAAARLEERAYIYRAVNDKDKREKLLGLTDEGREICSVLREAKIHWEDICLQGFTEQEREIFVRLSEQAARNAVEYRRKKECKYEW